jgi:hypothetical protein
MGQLDSEGGDTCTGYNMGKQSEEQPCTGVPPRTRPSRRHVRAPSARRGVAAQVEFNERHISKPGLIFKGKGLKPGAVLAERLVQLVSRLGSIAPVYPSL